MTANIIDTDITFQTTEEAEQFLSGLGFRSMPVRGRRVLSATGFDDFGNPIISFMRQHLAAPLTYNLVEMPRRPA